MAFCNNDIRKRDGDKETIEPITVTITLEEYRSLVEENTRLILENQRIYERLYDVERRLKERETNAE